MPFALTAVRGWGKPRMMPRGLMKWLNTTKFSAMMTTESDFYNIYYKSEKYNRVENSDKDD